MTVRIIQGDCRDVLRALPDESVHCVVTSPPYWGLRDYGIPPSLWDDDLGCDHKWGDTISVNATNHTTKARWNHTRNGRDELQPPEKRVSWLRTEVKQGQFCQICGAWAGALGLEPTYVLYVAHIVEVFREVRRVLRSDGTLWLNLGDSYTSGGRDRWNAGDNHLGQHGVQHGMSRPQTPVGLKPKDLVGIPWRVAFALQDDGWYLRQDLIWAKPNPMPESVTDRCTKAHEYLFLLSKSERYYFDQAAILEPCSLSTHARISQDSQNRSWNGSTFDGPRDLAIRPNTGRNRQRKLAAEGSGIKNNASMDAALAIMPESRNKRSVWTVTTQPFSEAHFATFPPALIEPCILAGAPKGGLVLDPFGGAGTTGLVADRLGRDAILIELNPEYAAMATKRLRNDAGMFAEIVST